MPLGTPGRYALKFPPLPLGVTVRVNPPSLTYPGGDLQWEGEHYGYSVTEGRFALSPTAGLECTGVGTWELVLNGGTSRVSGTCVYLGP